jgi:hypothetical protein
MGRLQRSDCLLASAIPNLIAKFYIIVVVNNKSIVSWDVMSYSLVERCQHYGGTFHFQGTKSGLSLVLFTQSSKICAEEYELIQFSGF